MRAILTTTDNKYFFRDSETHRLRGRESEVKLVYSLTLPALRETVEVRPHPTQCFELFPRWLPTRCGLGSFERSTLLLLLLVALPRMHCSSRRCYGYPQDLAAAGDFLLLDTEP